MSDTFALIVDNVNDAPTLSDIGDQTATEDVAFTLDLNVFASDVDAGDTVTVTAQGLPCMALAVCGRTERYPGKR